MKIISKPSRLTPLLLAPLLIAGILGTGASAVTLPSKTAPSTERTSGVCARLTPIKGTSEANITARITAMNSGFQTRLTTLAANQQETDQKVQDFRTDLTTKFTDKVATIAQKPGLTDNQKAAIDTYKAGMLAAEATREAAVDAARAAYRTALSEKITAHQTALGSAATAFQSSVNTALQTAGETCDSSAMQTLRTTVKDARATFQAARDSSRVHQDIEQLAATRRAAVKTANDTFKQSATNLSRTLAEALKTATTSQP